LLDASAQERLRGREAADFVCQYVHQLGLSIWTAIGQDVFKTVPYAFIWVQFWSIGRKGHQMQTRRAGKKLMYGVTTVNLAIVQQDHQMAWYLS